MSLINCPSCEGSGIQEERHDYGYTEQLGCSDCQATGKIEREAVLEHFLRRARIELDGVTQDAPFLLMAEIDAFLAGDVS